MASMNEVDGENSLDKNVLNEDAVVISGISGVFPKSNNVSEFMDNLYNKVDMVSDESRWQMKDLNLPRHLGKVDGMEKFDAQFFKVVYKLGCVMEPISKKLLEHAYGAIFDSGTNLNSLQGKNVGVFVGASYTDTSVLLMFDIFNRSSCIINGGSKSMLANRISYWVNGKGPSFGLDNACSSSMACLEQAYRSIKTGDCDAALVGGCSYCLHPVLSMYMARARLLCTDGKTKCFDKNGDGYVRADAVGLLFLQKAKNAKRIYAEVYHAKGLYKMKPDAKFLPIREPEDIEEFLEGFYSETNVNPNCVEYIEANGCGIAEADANEIRGISKVFCKDKSKSLKIGSVKSNMGNSEAASGICGLTKVCLAYHKGRLPANLHYTTPMDHIPSIHDGYIQVTIDETPFQRGFTALNNFSFTGSNYHVLLKGHYKKKDLHKYNAKMPYLVLASGRQENFVDKIFEHIKKEPIDQEQLALLQIDFEYDIPGHTGRGYAIFDRDENNKTKCLTKSVGYYQGEKRPLWFVFSGMGSQWVEMGSDLMKIPIFARAIEKCKVALQPKGIDIVEILTKKNDKLFDDTLNAFLGITAVQIGLTDILHDLGIVPDNIIGHSLGEMACCYQDKTLTTEELILATYCRGKVVNDATIEKGAMAAVGLGYKEIVKICPPDIDVACHNSSESSTISGAFEPMKLFVNSLKERGIFVKEVHSGDVPFHSRYISVLGKKLTDALGKIIKNPKQRSSKWISTSIPQDRWHEDLAKYSSPEYLANNLLSPVYFEEASKNIPNNAIIIEIAPHGLLQAILKRSHKECTHISLTKRGTPNGVIFLLEAIGKMYETGLNPKINVLYPKIEYPVSTETPLLSHFVEWVHSENWPQISYGMQEEQIMIARNYFMSIHDEDNKYLTDHARDGVNTLSEAFLLVLVWETFAMYRNIDYRYLSVTFNDIQFYREVKIIDDIPLNLSVVVNKGTNRFEVCYRETLVVSGMIKSDHMPVINDAVSRTRKIQFHQKIFDMFCDEEPILLTSEDIYKILEKRGIFYGESLKSIQSSNLECKYAKIQWAEDWVPFLDSLIQLNNLARGYDGVSVPKFIQRLEIDVVEQDNIKLELHNGINCCNAELSHLFGITRSGGVEIENIIYDDKPIIQIEPDVLETKHFFPYFTMHQIDMATALQLILQIVDQNVATEKIKLTEIATATDTKLFNIMKDVVNKTTLEVDVYAAEFENGNMQELIYTAQENDVANIFLVHNLLCDEKKLKNLHMVISKDTFILACEQGISKITQDTKNGFNIITSMSDGKKILVLLKKTNLKLDSTYIKVDFGNKFTWLPQVYAELQKTKRVVLVSERQPYSGLIGFLRKIRKTVSNKIATIIIDDLSAPKFNPLHQIYNEQLQKDLGISILRQGIWGSCYHVYSKKTTKLKNFTLETSTPGCLNKLTWIEASPILSNNLLVQICFAAVSYKDIDKALGRDQQEKLSFGMDFSGIDHNGERVMGVVDTGAISSSVIADSELLWPVPEHWSLEDAATVPLPYLTAYYCLTQKVNVRDGHKVFVNNGTEAFGQAVISICLSINCQVFTTVSNIRKKNFLIRMFPTLDENNIDYSGREHFDHMVLALTGANRCDIVINSANGIYRKAAMNCVGQNGVFLDISAYDMKENEKIGMYFLSKDKSYEAVDISNLFKLRSECLKKELQSLVSVGISKGIVRPLSRVVYSLANTPRAFKILSENNHRGRVVLRIRDPAFTNQGLDVIPRMIYSSQGIHIIVSDGTEFAVSLADRLVKKGARKIVINMQNSFVSGYMQYMFAQWKKQDVRIKLSLDKLHTEKGCYQMVRDVSKIGDINSIFILITTDCDERANIEKGFVDVVNKTVMTVFNLDIVSRNLCGSLRHFAILSCRSKYGNNEYTTAVLESICEERNKINLPALILCYDNLFYPENIARELDEKYLPLPESTLLEAMDRSLKLNYKNVFTFNLKKKYKSKLLTKIMKIIGFKRMYQLKEDEIISNFNWSKTDLQDIKFVVNGINSKVDLTIEEIKKCSLKKLGDLCGGAVSENRKITTGLEALYSSVDTEEDHLLMSNSVVPMDTLLNNGSLTLDPESTYLTVIPGFEGRCQQFKTITESLKIRAVAVQLGPDVSSESIPKMAADIRQKMRMSIVTKSKFYLLGYSLGVNIALELAALLEKEGHVGVVYCIDSSPDVVRIQLDTYLGSFTTNQLQNNIAEHMCFLISGETSVKLAKDLQNCKTWSDKVQCCLRRLRGVVNYSNQYKELVIDAAYKRILLAWEYRPDFTLESELVLIKGIPHSNFNGLTHDYNLSNYTNKPVQVFDIASDHTKAYADYKVASIVNKLLDPFILQQYKNTNLCHVYYT